MSFIVEYSRSRKRPKGKFTFWFLLLKAWAQNRHKGNFGTLGHVWAWQSKLELGPGFKNLGSFDLYSQKPLLSCDKYSPPLQWTSCDEYDKILIHFFNPGIVWFRWRGWDYTLKRSRMMIRPKNFFSAEEKEIENWNKKFNRRRWTCVKKYLRPLISTKRNKI